MHEPKRKILSLTNCVLEYRIPVYNLLSETFDVTVAHYGKPLNKSLINFKEIILTAKSVGPLVIFKENISDLAKGYDSVMALGELRFIQFFRLGFIIKRKFSLTFWNIGVSASYAKKFDEDRSLDFIRFRLMNKADSIVFYTDYPIKRYIEDGGVSEKKLFVANNTVEVLDRISIKKDKSYFLFVGTLYKAKKIFDLLEAYLLANNISSIKPLIIVGDGEEKGNIIKWIKENNLEKKITLAGAVFEQHALKFFYQDAIALISPGQAGLTVLNSFAYGVPFITSKDAITGGEVFNITNDINGIIYKEGVNELSNILIYLSENSNKVDKMSKNAQNYYFDKRTMNIMVQGLIDSLNYAFFNNRFRL